MKNKPFKDNKKYYIKKISIFLILAILLFILIKVNYNDARKKVSLGNTISDITTLTSKSNFSIDKIYLYSSANAINNTTKKSIWDLNVYQYTDIALYLSSNSSNEKQNTIKELYIDNVKFDSINTGTPNLYYKNLFDFGRFDLIKKNVISDRLNYKVLPPVEISEGDKDNLNTNTSTNELNEISDTSVNISNEVLENSLNNTINTEVPIVGAEVIDYAKPEIYSDCSVPITLEYTNLIKSNYLVSTIEKPIIYDGSLLKRAGIDLTSIACDLSFKVHIKNNLDESYVANVKLSIPLKDDIASSTIYTGSFTKEITTPINFVIEEKIK